jgi:hypothetical protein
MLLATLFGMFPFLLKLYADGGYQVGESVGEPSRWNTLRAPRVLHWYEARGLQATSSVLSPASCLAPRLPRKGLPCMKVAAGGTIFGKSSKRRNITFISLRG